MNIFKNNKLIVTTLIFVMFMALVRPPLLTAKERRGATVVVTMTDGRGVVKGELLAVKADALLVYDKDAGQGKILDLQQVVRVKVLKKSKTLKGMAIGFGVGLVIIFGSRLKFPNTGKDEEFHNLGFPFISGLCGGLLGALTSTPKKFLLAGESLESMQQNLERLKRYAREQYVEKLSLD
jgi:hypothetical protein